MSTQSRPWTRTIITSSLIGVGQSAAALLALLPFVMDDAGVPRFISHAAMAALSFQAVGMIAAFAVKAPAPFSVWGARTFSLALTAGLIWLAGWQAEFSLVLGFGLLAAHFGASRFGILAETVVAVSLITAAAGIAHPLLIYTLVPLTLGSAVAMTLIRLGLWSSPGFGPPRQDLAILSVVTGLFAPAIMLLGGWLGHDNALLSSAVVTQFVGLVTARWVSFDLISR